jgi:type II secretory pathway pseudopilin PulG
MVVIAIVVALLAITVPRYRALSAQNQRASCAANMKALGQALALFREDYQCFPPDSTEFLWTEEAVEEYEARYGVKPPGDHSLATLVGAAYHPDGTPFRTDVHGLGLLTLYYLGAYAAQWPPASSEPRLYEYEGMFGEYVLREGLDWRDQGLRELPWFKSAGYIDDLDAFHCPSNDIELPEPALVQRAQISTAGADAGLPELSGWGNYDVYYRRNFWHAGRPMPGMTDGRHLFQAYPPADTVVTWCPYHRTSSAPSGPGIPGMPNPGDQDLVLFADGTVRRMATQPLNRMYAEPSAGAGWPQGPIM